MPDYSQLRELCRKESEVSTSVIDNFILHYAAKRDRVDQEFDVRLSRFRHAQTDLPENWAGLVRAQYIGHRIFKQQGLINKYLNHSAIKDLLVEEQNHLRFTAMHPWRFSFSEILGNPSTDFYEMQDVFTQEIYLLYSRSVSQTLSARPVTLWFNLIGYNGGCWQTYGPITGFQSFDADDIFFFATELNGSIESVSDLTKDLENNPVPYLMLVSGSILPRVQSKGFEVVHVSSEVDSPEFDIETLKKKFKTLYAHEVFQISDNILSAPPHFAEAYLDEARGITMLSALTEQGYAAMAKKLKPFGFDIPTDPDVRFHLPMMTIINKLLKKDIELSPYSRLFEVKSSPDNKAMIENLNRFMSLAMADINSGKEPDINAIAEQVGIDAEIARDLFQQAMKSFDRLRQ